MHNGTFWKRVERFPPILCRLLARKPYGRPLTDTEIAQKAGLSTYQVCTLAQSADWRGVDIYTMRSFMQACGININDHNSIRRVENYLAGKLVNGTRLAPAFSYLKRSPEWTTIFKPTLKRWLQSQGE